jgi:DNA-binding CsgD family transcriptional regulator
MTSDERNPKHILLIEPSLMVSNGFTILIENAIGYQFIGAIQDTERLQGKILCGSPEILIINPLVLSLQHRMSIRSYLGISNNTALVALIYTFVDEWMLNQFDAILTINDSQTQIVNKLNDIKFQAKQTEDSNAELSERENEILTSIVKGMTNKEIADQYFLSIHTVITHRKNIIRKTGIKSVSGLTVYALLNNLITYEDIN